jgi:parallel beta-helix repeat protein
MRRFLRLTLLTALAGVMLIALSPGNAVASHVQCGDVITQDTTLDSDLVDCPGDGIVIGANDIALDLRGHTVRGDGTGLDEGIDNSAGFDGLSVRGPGIVEHFDTGMLLEGSSDSEILSVTTRENHDDGIRLSHTQNSEVVDNLTFGNGHDGQGDVLAVGCGIQLSDSIANRLARNQTASPMLRGNRGSGICLTHSDLNRIDGNSVWGNLIGIFLVASNSNRLERNVTALATSVPTVPFLAGGAAGIVLNGSSDNTIAANSVPGAAFVGINIMDNSDRNLIERNTVPRVGFSITRLASVGIQITRSDANRIERNSLFDDGYGIGLVDANENVLSRNSMHDIQINGAFLVRSVQNRIEKNVVEGGTFRGVTVHDSSGIGLIDNSHDNVIVKNSVSNLDAGIFVRRTHGNRIERNSSFDNIFDGIFVVNSFDSVIQRNTASGNGRHGLLLGLSFQNDVRRNTTDGNVGAGVAVLNTLDNHDFGPSDRNTIARNSASGNGADGFIVVSRDSRLDSNVATSNGDDGIDIDDGLRTTVVNNTANDNVDLGIEAAANVIDGGGNTASGNGNPLQCLNVACN